jgi:predicted urease superfamily metal-dependent hydrolase
MAEKACHVVASTAQVGLIQALGRTGRDHESVDTLLFIARRLHNYV